VIRSGIFLPLPFSAAAYFLFANREKYRRMSLNSINHCLIIAQPHRHPVIDPID